jgi:hypothetical protein
MFQFRIIEVAADDVPPLSANRSHDGSFDSILSRPTYLVGSQAEIAVGNEEDCMGHGR